MIHCKFKSEFYKFQLPFAISYLNLELQNLYFSIQNILLAVTVQIFVYYIKSSKDMLYVHTKDPDRKCWLLFKHK